MNNELKCPNCGTVFQIDEQDYESIVKQIRDKEFEREINVREQQYKNDKEQALKLAEVKAEKDLADELNKKELEIASLKNELKLKETETENRLEKKYSEELNRKVVEITELKNEIKLKDTEKELALKDIVNEKDKEIDSLNTRLESNKNEFLVKEQSLKDKYEEKIKDVPTEVTNEFEKVITLQVLDNYWMEHINTMSHLREGIHLRGYAQEDPLRAYTMEGFDLFDNMLQEIDKEITNFLVKAQVTQNLERKEVSKNKITNDNDDTKAINKPKKAKKVGRNDQCPCGSGKKYKQCCGK